MRQAIACLALLTILHLRQTILQALIPQLPLQKKNGMTVLRAVALVDANLVVAQEKMSMLKMVDAEFVVVRVNVQAAMVVEVGRYNPIDKIL